MARFIRVGYDGSLTPIEAANLTEARLHNPEAFTFRPAPPNNPGAYSIEHRPEQIRTPNGGFMYRPGITDWCVVMPDGQIESRWETAEKAEGQRSKLNSGERQPNWTQRSMHAPEPVRDVDTFDTQQRADRGKPDNPAPHPTTQGATVPSADELRSHIDSFGDTLDRYTGTMQSAVEASDVTTQNLARIMQNLEETMSMLQAAHDHADQTDNAVTATERELDSLQGAAREALENSNQSVAHETISITSEAAQNADELAAQSANLTTMIEEAVDALSALIHRLDTADGRSREINAALGTLVAQVARAAQGMHETANAI